MLYVIIAVVFGLCLGSFFNVVIIRGVESERQHCHGKRSECMECGHKLGVLDLVPVFSWLFLGGRCRYCKAKISWIYPVGEALTALGFAVVGLQVKDFMFATGGWWKPEYIISVLDIAIMLLAVIALSLSTISDIREKMIYIMPVYVVTALMIVLRSIQIVAEYNMYGLLFHKQIWISRAVMFIGLMLTFIALRRILSNKIGSGDFDVLLMLYVAGGVNTMFNSMFIGSIIGCIGVLILTMMKKFSKGTAIPMVPLLYLGYLAQIFIDLIKLPF